MNKRTATRVKNAIKRKLEAEGWTKMDLTLVDHNHQGLKRGNWAVIGPEGRGDWILKVPYDLVPGVAFIEPINCATLGVYDYE